MASARAHINPDILVWARKRLNADPAVLAKRVGTSQEIYEKWEQGTRRPTIKQLRKVARQLRRPIAHFYLEDYPDESEPRVEMRRVFGGNPRADSFEFSREVQECMRRREIALQLFERLGEAPPTLPEPFDASFDPEEAGFTVRCDLLNLDDGEQSDWRGRYEALREWRALLEGVGVLSFQMSGIALSEARGFAFAKRPLPVAAFNSKDSVRGRIFTLMHEFAHILLGASTFIPRCRSIATMKQNAGATAWRLLFSFRRTTFSACNRCEEKRPPRSEQLVRLKRWRTATR